MTTKWDIHVFSEVMCKGLGSVPASQQAGDVGDIIGYEVCKGVYNRYNCYSSYNSYNKEVTLNTVNVNEVCPLQSDRLLKKY